MRTPIFSWTSQDIQHWPKSTDWFWAVGIVAVSMAILAFYFANPLFGVLIILAAFTASLNAVREPSTTKYELTERGVIIDRTFYPFINLESFWIYDHFKGPRMIIKSRKAFVPYIIVPIEEYHPEDVHEFVSLYLKEEEMYEPTLKLVLERLGF